MNWAGALFEATERAELRRATVAFLHSCCGVPEYEIARRLQLSVVELRYIFSEQLEAGPCLDGDAIVALYNRAIAGDQEAAFVYLAASRWGRRPFAEILAMPQGALRRCPN